MRQIVKQGFDIMPSQLYRDKVKQHLLNNKIYLQQISNKDEEYYEQYQEQIKKTYKEYSHLERLSLDTIATACFYAERNNIPIVLCDQPEEIFRQEIANSNTLMQLQNIFTRCSRQIALEPDLQPQNPLSVAFSLFPEQFLGQSDQYISTVLQYLSAKKINKITALLGNVQSESIEEILENRKIGHLADFLKPSNVQHSLVRDITSEEIIEKHAILDTMYYGKDIFDNFDQKEFHTTYEMINRYGDPQYIDRSRLNRLRQIHFDCLKKYQRFAEQEFSEGKNQLKREFMKKVGYAL